MTGTLLWLLAVPASFVVGTAVWNLLFPPPGERDLWREQERHGLLRAVVTSRPHHGSAAPSPSGSEWRIAA